jgi:hypothetical protein
LGTNFGNEGEILASEPVSADVTFALSNVACSSVGHQQKSGSDAQNPGFCWSSLGRTRDESMNSPTIGLRVASVVFGLMAIAQLVRLLIRPEVLVAGYSMPLWPSGLTLIFLGALSIWMGKLARTSTK